MLRVNVGLSRKLSKDFCSTGYAINLDGEITAAISDAEAVVEQVKELFDLAEEALDQQIQREQGTDELAGRDGYRRNEDLPQSGPDRRAESNGQSQQNGQNHQNGDLATNKQVKYLLDIAKQQKLTTLQLEERIAAIMGYQVGVYDLTKKAAGTVIDALTGKSTNGKAAAPHVVVHVHRGESRLIGSEHMQIPRPHWSYSQLAQYLRCPLQYYFERIARLPRPFAPSGLVLGRAVHEALAEYHRRLQRNETNGMEAIKTTFRLAWKQAESERPIQYRPGETQQGLIELGLGLLDLYLNQPAPENIVAVEQSWLVPIITSRGEILEKPLAATIDLLIQEDERLVVTEFKTSSRRYSQTEVEIAQQATAYVQVINSRYQQLPQVRYVVLVKNNPPAIQEIKAKRTESELHRLGDIFQMVERSIAAGGFYPIESAQNCSSCAFRQPCREWKGTPSKYELLSHCRRPEGTTC